MATYECPYCKATCLTPKAAANHCADYRRIQYGEEPGKRDCTICHGTGEIAGFLGPDQPCWRCHGSGKVD